MTYQDGYFYTDSSDPYRREYAGFGRVKVIEDTGASTVTYFYQGRRDANADRISKK